MNSKLMFKTVFLIVILLLLVLMGLHNQASVAFKLPPLLSTSINQPAAIMYFAFFAVGLLTGVVLTASLGKGGGSGGTRSSKGDK
jgi:uncharacterized integral membrane protein